jgi:hypothetical protein
MIRWPAVRLAGCVVCAGLIVSNDSPPFEARLPPAKTEPAALQIPSPADDANSPPRDVRLTGIVIAPDLRIAIFAVSGANSLVLSEGQRLNDWRLDRILPGEVLLSDRGSTIKLEPRPDANLVRPAPPVAVRSDTLEPSVPSGAELAGVPEEPTATTPVPAGNLSAAMPVQSQVYTYYFPENYAGYGRNYPSYDYYPYLYPSFAYVDPLGSASRFDFLHRHDIHRDGFRGVAMPIHRNSVPFHAATIPFHGGGHH